MDERLSKAIVHQGTDLQKRVEFIQKMLKCNTLAIENSQKMVELLRVDLQAANIAVDVLRDEYRKILKEDDRYDTPKPDSEGER